MSDIENIKKLRQSTGAGFKDCNAALKESSGDLEKAAEILRVKGIAKASKKMSRDAKEGVIVVSGDSKKTSLIEVNCETDFVAKNDDFLNFVKELSEINNQCSSDKDKLNKSAMANGKTVEENLVALIAKIGEKITIGKTSTIENSNSQNFIYQHSVIKDNVSKLGVVVSIETSEDNDQIKSFGKQLSMHIAASNPIALNSDEIKEDIIQKEQELIAEELKNSGKPEEIAKKISLGKINKFKEENSLMTQDWVMEPKKKVKDILTEINIPNLKIKEFTRIKNRRIMFNPSQYDEKMTKTLDVFSKELSSLRTGRANASMLDLVKVDVYGQQMPINQLASITTPEPRTINIQVWDINNVNLIDAAIKKSELGLNPQIDGQLIRLPVPDLSEERRNEMKKIVKSMGEKCKVSIRNIRREANDDLKKLLKNKEISEDEVKKNEKIIQDFTDKNIKLIDDKVISKEKDIMTI